MRTVQEIFDLAFKGIDIPGVYCTNHIRYVPGGYMCRILLDLFHANVITAQEREKVAQVIGVQLNDLLGEPNTAFTSVSAASNNTMRLSLVRYGLSKIGVSWGELSIEDRAPLHHFSKCGDIAKCIIGIYKDWENRQTHIDIAANLAAGYYKEFVA